MRLLAGVLCLLVAAVPVRAQNLAVVDRPLVTDTAQVLDSGQVLAGAGVEYVRLPEPGDAYLASAPVLGMRVGIADLAEFSATYRWVWRESTRRSANGTGDLFLFGKLRLLDGLRDDGTPSAVPATAVRLGVKLPNASARDGLGTNNTDFFMSLLVTPRHGPIELRLSGGLLILESPVDPLAQNDAWAYGAALLVHLPGGATPFVEYYGQNTNVRPFDLAEARAGVRWVRGDFGVDLSGSVGLTGSGGRGYSGELSRDWGLAAGASYRFVLPGFGRTWGRPNGRRLEAPGR